MSYDLSIRSDDTFTDKADRVPLSAFISALPGVTRDTDWHFALEETSGGFRVEIDLELVSPEGDSLEAGPSDCINCIRIHVTSGGADVSEDISDSYRDVCSQIAAHVGWRVFDEQLGEYVDLT